MREDRIAREIEGQKVGGETENELCGEYDSMPFMQTQIEGVDLAEGEEEHEENEPGQDGLEGQEPWVENGSYEH